jgi:hypothetical protein
MDIYTILKEGLRGEGSDKMWCTTKILSDAIEQYVPDKQKEAIKTKVYYSTFGGHFNRDFADTAISKMYYIDANGVKHQAPYWGEPEVRLAYEQIKSKIPHYNFYDFEVTLNMVKSDNCNKLKKWFPNATDEELKGKLIEEAVNYLDDEDNPYGDEKIWMYLNK